MQLSVLKKQHHLPADHTEAILLIHTLFCALWTFENGLGLPQRISG